MVTFRKNNNHNRRGRFRNNDRNFKRNGDSSKFKSDFSTKYAGNTSEILFFLQQYLPDIRRIYEYLQDIRRIYGVFESFHNLRVHFLNYFSYSTIIFSKVLQKTAVLSKYVGNTSYILRKYAVYLEYSCGAVRLSLLFERKQKILSVPFSTIFMKF